MNLEPGDFVGITFWVISVAMVASTVFFLMEANRCATKWRTSLVVAALVTLVAAIHYYYMRDVWVETGESPIVFRYVDWIITVPLQIIEFYLILAAVGAVASSVLRNLFIASLVMLIPGYLGEAGYIPAMVGFVIGMLGWIYILYAIFAGEAQSRLSEASEGVQSAYKTMRLIVLVGWAIYPIGYILGYAGEGTDPAVVNAVYNLADVVNKIAFGLMIWAAATSEES